MGAWADAWDEEGRRREREMRLRGVVSLSLGMCWISGRSGMMAQEVGLLRWLVQWLIGHH